MAQARDIRKAEIKARKERQARLAEQDERNAAAVKEAEEAAALARENAPLTHVQRSAGYEAPGGAKAAAGPAENKAAAPATTGKRK
jgi:hypothetical protein